MKNEHESPYEQQAREALVGALLGDVQAMPVSDEDLAVVAEHGMKSLSEADRERVLNAMVLNTNGAAGTVDVFRQLQNETKDVVIEEASGVETENHQKKFDLVSGSLTGLWTLAACLALFLSIGVFDQTTTSKLPLENELNISDLETDQEKILGQILMDIKESMEAHTDSGASSWESKKMWLASSVLMMAIIPPALWMYRRKRK